MEFPTTRPSHLWSDDDVNTFSMELIEQALQSPCNEATIMYFQAIDIVLCYARVHNRWPTHADIESQGFTNHMPLKMTCTTVVTWLCSACYHGSLDFHLRLLHAHAEKILDNLHPWTSPFRTESVQGNTDMTTRQGKEHSDSRFTAENASLRTQKSQEQHGDMPDLRSPQPMTTEEFEAMVERPEVIAITSHHNQDEDADKISTDLIDQFVNDMYLTLQPSDDTFLPEHESPRSPTFMYMNSPPMPDIPLLSPTVPFESELFIGPEDFSPQWSNMEMINDGTISNNQNLYNMELNNTNLSSIDPNVMNHSNSYPSTIDCSTANALPSSQAVENCAVGSYQSVSTPSHQKPWQQPPATSNTNYSTPSTPGLEGVFGGPAGFRQVSTTTTVTTDYIVPRSGIPTPSMDRPGWSASTQNLPYDSLLSGELFENVQLDSSGGNGAQSFRQ